MAVTATINVSGVAALRYVLVDTTTFYFTNGVDGQRLALTLQQDATGSRTVVSGNCPGLQQPSTTANDDTTQLLIYDAATNTWIGTGMAVQSQGGSTLTAKAATGSAGWAKGLYTLGSSGAITITVTNPVAGPPGVGNDGEEMTFCNITGHAHAVTMATADTVNGVDTTITTAGAVGNAFTIRAFNGNVYIVAASGALTLS